MSKRSYIAARTAEELEEFNKSVNDGMDGGFVIMPTEMYHDLIPEDKDKAHFLSAYKDYNLKFYSIN